MDEMIEKFAELRSIRSHLQLIGSWHPNSCDTDRQIEAEIQWLDAKIKRNLCMQR